MTVNPQQVNIIASVVRSEEAVAMDVWHELCVSRTAKNGILQIDNQRPVEGMAEVNSFILFLNIYSTVQKLVSVRFLKIFWNVFILTKAAFIWS